jgi:FSR family fosmidomycin resistance protein-like MFS transporter
VLAVPGIAGSLLDPVIGIAGDTHRRRALLIAGGVGFALSAALSGVAIGFWSLLVALLIGNPATGAFVSLAQATLMDAAPAQRARNMARWTVAGSVGYVAGPVLLVAAVKLGFGWRGMLLALALPAIPLALAVRPAPSPAAAPDWRGFVYALRDREVVRWLVVLESADLLLDVFHAFLALYFVDVAGDRPVAAAFAVAVWTGAGFVGDVALLPVLRRVDGMTYVRGTAAVTLAAYPAFLLVSEPAVKLVLLAALGFLGAGWYAIPKAALYDALPARSGLAVAVGGAGGLVGACIPAAIGALAGAVGLGVTMWVLVLAPVALLACIPSRR